MTAPHNAEVTLQDLERFVTLGRKVLVYEPWLGAYLEVSRVAFLLRLRELSDNRKFDTVHISYTPAWLHVTPFAGEHCA